jgi:hypothetical protein
MKKRTIQKQLKKHLSHKRYVRLTRTIGNESHISTGILLSKSKDFILIQETNNFKVLGYQIFPIQTISHVRYIDYDKTIERILKSEGQYAKAKLKYNINLKNWKTICNDIQNTGLPIISECEHPNIESFCIGKLMTVNKKSISIKYFNANGIYDKKNTKNHFKNITRLSINDRYADVFSKYAK